MESKTIKLYLFLLLTIFFINFSSTLLANEQATHQTNDQAVYQSIVYPKISLLTCDSGNELYSTFGHSALRVYYPESGKDIVFNFGLFDFNTPYFYTKFVRGKLKYMLGIQYTSDFIEQFKWEKRGVKEQILNLTETQTQELIDRLFCTISLLFIALLQIVWAYGIQYVEPGFIPIVTTLAQSFAIRLILPYSSGTIVKPTSSR